MTDNQKPVSQTTKEMGAILNKAYADGAPFWDAFVAAAKAYADHLDQFEKIKFQTEYGMIYVSITRSDPYPDSFVEIRK